ncbi:hypothetical protein ACI65C_006462 [Semiaphis heraclei]
MDWNLANLKFCCKIMGVKDEWFHCDYWPVVSFDHIKNSLPPETDFKDFWPAMASDLFLFTRKKIMLHNPPGSWFKVLPEVVTDDSTLTAPAAPQSTELMLNQMLQQEQQPQEILTTPPIQAHENADKAANKLQQEQQPQEILTTPPTQAHANSDTAAYKVHIVSLEGKIIYCINSKPGIYYSDLMVTLKEIVQMVLPLCNVAKCAHVLYKYLKIPLLFGKPDQLAVLSENKLIWSMNPGDTPMAMLLDIKKMYGNIFFYGGGPGRGRGRGHGNSNGGSRGGGRGRGHGRDGGDKSAEKFTGKCDLCKEKGHKVLECPKFR